ncbi:DNA-directed RNA polymerase subunit H [Candidatus Woesearchaeota archaeon]|nr:DNA-directed RNA polymerase subunit H [Candidatus Woesearchaeota archaeon]
MGKEQEHILVPKHTKLDEKEIQEVLEKYNVALRQLPKILKSDPAIKELNVNPGDVIKITRISPTTGKSDFFRVVLND